jgi:hypothetical protein
MNIPLYKGYEDPTKPIIALWLDKNLRIEMLENIHLHFGYDGIYRLELSVREFLELANALERVDEKA